MTDLKVFLHRKSEDEWWPTSTVTMRPSFLFQLEIFDKLPCIKIMSCPVGLGVIFGLGPEFRLFSISSAAINSITFYNFNTQTKVADTLLHTSKGNLCSMLSNFCWHIFHHHCRCLHNNSPNTSLFRGTHWQSKMKHVLWFDKRIAY